MRTPRYTAQLATIFSQKASAILRSNYWVVTEGFTYRITEDGSEVIHVPKGYLTGGASVPKFFQNLIPVWGLHGQACVVHDYLCEYLQIWKDGKIVKIDRNRCDEILNEALKVSGVSSAIKRTIYKAVCFHRHFTAAINPTFSLEKRDLERALVKVFDERGYWE